MNGFLRRLKIYQIVSKRLPKFCNKEMEVSLNFKLMPICHFGAENIGTCSLSVSSNVLHGSLATVF